MYTQCPGCLSLYPIAIDALVSGRGRAICAKCSAEFDVLASLSDQLPRPPDTMLTRHLVGNLPTLSVIASKLRTGQPDLFIATAVDPVRDPVAELQAASAARSDAVAEPSFASRRERRAPARNSARAWRYANILLCLGLLGQLVYATRQHWLDSASTRPYLDAACERLGCRLPPRRDVAQIALVARDVRPHPSEAGALVISATMLNRASFSQPYPTLEITLSNLDEQRIAMRRMAPQDYLNDSRALARGLPAGATATIDLEVADPGKQAVAFEFKFL